MFAEKVLVRDGKIYFEPDAINTYAIAALAEFLRYLYLTNGLNFTIETVFSHPSKLAFLQQAQDHGYRIYLYFVATENPELNVKRVRQRVAEGGHDIPPAKIIERYERCLDNFYPALQFAYRAFFWDNSDKRPLLFAEMTPDRQVSVLANLIPGWFQRCVLAKMVAEG